MVKNLKVGDRFCDGDLQYEVLSLTNIDGVYVSKVVGKAPATATPLAEPITESKTDISEMNYTDLQRKAKEKGVSAKGTKEELLERLKALV